MNLQMIRRVLATTVLTATLFAGVTANADPLPVPQKFEVIVPPVSLLSPPNGVESTYNTVFTWSDTGTPNTYKLKIKNTNTGQKLTSSVDPATCNEAGFCTRSGDAIDLFEHVEDGDVIQWWVVAKYKDGKVKSSKRTLIMNTVSAPTTMQPGHTDNLYSENPLRWNDTFENMQYTLVVKYVDGGAVAHKSTMHSNACEDMCEVNPFEGQPFPDYELFTWFVKAKGYNGDKAKSAQQTFAAMPAAVATDAAK
jgi:hypothetical protein